MFSFVVVIENRKNQALEVTIGSVKRKPFTLVSPSLPGYKGNDIGTLPFNCDHVQIYFKIYLAESATPF